MKNRKCSYTATEEIEGNIKKVTKYGITLSEAFEKEMKGKTYMMILVEDEADGTVHEVFANSIKFTK